MNEYIFIIGYVVWVLMSFCTGFLLGKSFVKETKIKKIDYLGIDKSDISGHTHEYILGWNNAVKMMDSNDLLNK